MYTHTPHQTYTYTQPLQPTQYNLHPCTQLSEHLTRQVKILPKQVRRWASNSISLLQTPPKVVQWQVELLAKLFSISESIQSMKKMTTAAGITFSITHICVIYRYTYKYYIYIQYITIYIHDGTWLAERKVNMCHISFWVCYVSLRLWLEGMFKRHREPSLTSRPLPLLDWKEKPVHRP